MNAIPKDVAAQLCQEICLEQVTRWYSWLFSPCWTCQVFANGNPEKMQIGDRSGYTGCPRVNARFQTQFAGQRVGLPQPSLP